METRLKIFELQRHWATDDKASAHVKQWAKEFNVEIISVDSKEFDGIEPGSDYHEPGNPMKFLRVHVCYSLLPDTEYDLCLDCGELMSKKWSRCETCDRLKDYCRK